MKKHTKVYMNHFGYGVDDFIPCEVCGKRAVDIHHIEARGMGGTTRKEEIENLMALCRVCHVEFGDKKQFIGLLRNKHDQKLQTKALTKTWLVIKPSKKVG